MQVRVKEYYTKDNVYVHGYSFICHTCIILQRTWCWPRSLASLISCVRMSIVSLLSWKSLEWIDSGSGTNSAGCFRFSTRNPTVDVMSASLGRKSFTLWEVRSHCGVLSAKSNSQREGGLSLQASDLGMVIWRGMYVKLLGCNT